MSDSYGTDGPRALDSAVYGEGAYGAGMSMASLRHQGQLQYDHSPVPRGAYGHTQCDVRARVEPGVDSNDVVYGNEEDDEEEDGEDDGDYEDREDREDRDPAQARQASTGAGQAGQANGSVPPNTVMSTDILRYLAQETRLFQEHMQAACKQYEETKRVPDSLFGVKKVRALQKRSGRKATAGVPRKLTAFNIFIKRRIEEIKGADPFGEQSGTEMFKRVVEEWRGMSAEEKEAFKREIPAVQVSDGGKHGQGEGVDEGEGEDDGGKDGNVGNNGAKKVARGRRARKPETRPIRI